MKPYLLEISDDATGSTATILASLGFNCFSWRPMLEEGLHEVLWAHPDFVSGQQSPSGSGIPLLFPFPGRIRGATFTYANRQYALEPGDPLGNAIHGFVFNRPWRVVEQQGARAVGEFQASVDDPKILDRWPADFRIRVSYELRGQALVSNICYENTGEGPLPCGFGTHAYFRLPLFGQGAVGDTIVTVPADRYWELEQMLATGKQLPIDSDGDDFRGIGEGLILSDFQLDNIFTNLRADADGMIRTRLAQPGGGPAVIQTFDTTFTQCVVYTPAHREAICQEPCTCVPDPFRLSVEGHETGLQTLAPGETFETTIRIEVG